MQLILICLLSVLLPLGGGREGAVSDSILGNQFPSSSGEGLGKGAWSDFEADFLSDEERAEDEDVMEQLELLRELYEHPLDINTATVEDLQQLPFLTDTQIEQIHAYIYLHGQMQTLAELRLVPLMDEVTRRRISLFVAPSPQPSPPGRRGSPAGEEKKNIFRGLRHDFSTRLDVPLYYRMGQQKEGGYRGDPLGNRVRYTLGNNRHFDAGFRLEKDAGERFYDSYGGYVMLRAVGIVERAVVGDYRIGMGEGLVLGGSAWSSKSAPSLKMQSGLRAMTSMDEVRFMRGAAVTLSPWKHWSVTLFGSYRERDATLTKDGSVQTLQAGGYHRTATEWERRGNTGSTTVGGNVQWQAKGFHLGATGYWQGFSRTLEPGTQQYRLIYPRGKQFGVGGLNYGYARYRLSLAGETAYSSTGGMATINRASWIISRRYTLSAVQRFYAYQYYSFHANALSENTNAQNESGVLLHLQAEPLDGLHVTAYADIFHNPWPRYRMTHGSTGQELSLQGEYTLNQRHTLLARYQFKRKETGDQMEPHHRVKLRWTVQPGKNWRWQTTGAMHSVLGSMGLSLAQSMRCTLPRPNITLGCQLAYFHTDDYLSRVYLSMPTLYNSISNALFYGHGMHGALTCRWQDKRSRLMLEARYGMLRYFDREEQGTGLQAIMSPWKNDLSVQLRVRI